MNREFWITSSNEYRRVRLSGKSYAHPLAVIIIAKGISDHSRAGIITGKSIGCAVKRNQAKRRIREILRKYLEKTSEPCDIVVIGRKPISEAKFQDIQRVISSTMVRAGILDQNDSWL